MSPPEVAARGARYVLRGILPGGPPTWILSDGDRFFVPHEPASYPADSPTAMVQLWADRGRAKFVEAPEPRPYLTPLPVARAFLPAVNFRAHSAESRMQEPTEPYFFLKFANAAVPHGTSVTVPRQATKVDYEGEIGAVLGTSGKHWNEAEAAEAIFGYTAANDLSLRDYQFREQPRYGKNWVMGKMFDGALPLGPWILPRELAPSGDLEIRTRVNGEVRQDGSSRDMIFSFPKLLAYLSEVNTLGPGDVLMSGTPAGVAAHQGERYLKDGDTVEVEVAPVGTLRHTIRFERAP